MGFECDFTVLIFSKNELILVPMPQAPNNEQGGYSKPQARSNCDVISFQSDMGTNRQTDQQTDGRTDGRT
jgi:hypothetical protein